MATFKVVSRTRKEYNTVYIRISHRSATDYIRTEMTVHKSGVNKKNEISDHFILSNCAQRIRDYIFKLNNFNTENWTVQEVKKFLLSEKEGISFVDFAEKYIRNMINENRDKPAANYQCALNSLKAHYNRDELLFSDITANELRRWIKNLSSTKRAKQMYPVCIKKIFDEGCLEYNDYDKNIIRIPNQPFKAVDIPNADIPKKRSVEADIIRKIIDIVPQTDRETLAHDVAMQVAAMNPKWPTYDAVPEEEIARKKAELETAFENDAKNAKKPADVRDKIIEGQLKKYFAELILSEQIYWKDDSKTVDQLIKEHIAKLGENIVVRQFKRIELGVSE